MPRPFDRHQHPLRAPWRAAGLAAALIAALPALPAGGQTPSPEPCFADCADGLSGARDRGPLAGAPAPALDAALWLLAPGRDAEPRTLGALLGGRPVILAFGSYT